MNSTSQQDLGKLLLRVSRATTRHRRVIRGDRYTVAPGERPLLSGPRQLGPTQQPLAATASEALPRPPSLRPLAAAGSVAMVEPAGPEQGGRPVQ